MYRGEDGRAYSDEREYNKRKEEDEEYILDMVGLNLMGDPEDELLYKEEQDFTVRIKRPRRKAKNDIATMMKFANEVIKNLELAENETAITLDFSEVTDFSTARLDEVKIGNDGKESDKKNK